MTHQIYLTNERFDGFQTALANPQLMKTSKFTPRYTLSNAPWA